MSVLRNIYTPKIILVALVTTVNLCAINLADAASVSYELAPVWNLGNAKDSTGFGNVAYPYKIGMYEVTTI